MSSPTLRQARATDSDALARFGAWVFAHTFGTNYPAPDLASFLDRSYAPAKIASEIARPDCLMDLVEDDAGQIGAYCFSGPLDLPVEAPELGAWELKRLYLAPHLQGTGIADQLLDRCVEAAIKAGAPALYLGVWSQNPRAQAFYARRGFVRCGQYQFPVGSVLDDEWILRRALPSAG